MTPWSFASPNLPNISMNLANSFGISILFFLKNIGYDCGNTTYDPSKWTTILKRGSGEFLQMRKLMHHQMQNVKKSMDLKGVSLYHVCSP